MSDESFKIVIKSINQVFPDETIECQREWTFRQLKIHVSQLKSDEKFVHNRQIHSQRLIRDDEILKNVFKQYSEDSPPVLYIVPPPPPPSSSTSSTIRKRNTTTTSTPTTTTNATTNQIPIPNQQFPFSSFSPSFDMSAYSPYLLQGANLPGMLGYGFNLIPPQPLQQQQYTPQQQHFSMLHQQQQLYYNQLNHFLMHYYSHQHQNTSTQPPTAPQPQQPNPPPPPPQQPPPQQANNLNNGAFLMEDDDDGRRRDWLDWSYVMLRFVMLMCILYFYSTPARFFTFISISLILVVLQMSWVHRLFIERFLGILPQQNQARQPAAAAEQAQQPAAEQQQAANNEQQQQQEASNAQQNNQNNQQPQAPEAPRNAFSIFCSFIVGFFTSLAPQIPPPVNNN